jgi:hypothetical protein
VPPSQPDAGEAGTMTVIEAILLGLSVLAFIYLGVVMFKPEWF